MAGEDLGHLEGLGEEALDLASAGHRQLVLLGQLVHSQDGDDVLQGLVVLEEEEAWRRQGAGGGEWLESACQNGCAWKPQMLKGFFRPVVLLRPLTIIFHKQQMQVWNKIKVLIS